MGRDGGYRMFEEMVVGAYDLGKLDRDLLRVLMGPYRGAGIDGGGRRGLEAHDGLTAEEVVLKVWHGTFPARPAVPRDRDDWDDGDRIAWGEHREEVLGAFRGIANGVFGW